jgi:hypothetical protein
MQEASVNTPSGRQPFRLTYVAYIPGFFTNVVGLSRCSSLDIHFNSGRNCLYQRVPSDERHEKHVLCDVYQKARESLYEALSGCQGTSYTRSHERYQWTIGTVQHLRILCATSSTRTVTGCLIETRRHVRLQEHCRQQQQYQEKSGETAT